MKIKKENQNTNQITCKCGSIEFERTMQEDGCIVTIENLPGGGFDETVVREGEAQFEYKCVTCGDPFKDGQN
jgi:DNA-directed RNA polymerase subunit RPC12/RpoP